MAEFITDILGITPPELTGYVREFVTGGLVFEGLFPSTPVEDILYEMEAIDLTGMHEVARYRSWDTVPPIGKRPGVQLIGGELPPLAWSYRLNEEDIARFGRLRAAIAARTDQRVVDTIFNDALRASWAVQNRITLAQAELLQTGSLTLTELGQPLTGNAVQATFAVPSGQMNVAPAAALWSDHTNAKPINDLIEWEYQYSLNNNDMFPEAWLVSRKVMLDLVQNTQILSTVPYASGGRESAVPTYVNDAAVSQAFQMAGVQGEIRVVNTKRPPLAGGARTLLIDETKVIGVRAGMGKTLYGPPPVLAMLNAKSDGYIERQDQPGIVAYGLQEIRPPQVITTAEGVAMPVLSNPFALFVAVVR